MPRLFMAWYMNVSDQPDTREAGIRPIEVRIPPIAALGGDEVIRKLPGVLMP